MVPLWTSRPSESRLLHTLLSCTVLTNTARCRTTYVEEKRLIYAPNSKAETAKPAPPKSVRPFNAWAEKLVGAQGFPAAPGAISARSGDKGDKGNKRKADDSVVEERDILFDGVKFTARKTGPLVEIVDRDTIGLGEGGWPVGKVLRFTVSKKDGTADMGAGAETEQGEYFNFTAVKLALLPICKPAFVSLLPAARPIAALPTGTTSMAVDTPAAPVAPVVVDSSNPQEYPTLGQVSFREVVTEEILAKLRADVGVWEGRTLTWVRASGECLSPVIHYGQ